MVTRFWFPLNTISDVNPNFGAWNEVDGALRRKLVNVKGTSAITIGTRHNWVAGVTQLDRQYVSDPLAAGISFSAVTVKLVLMAREYNNADNSTSRLLVKIVNRAGDTIQQTLLALGQFGPNVEYINNATHRNKQFANGDIVTGTYVTAQGDRLVVEIGHADIAGATPEASCKFGENAADAGDNETGTTDAAGWIEFSNNIKFEQTKTFKVDALLKATKTKTFKIDSILKKSGIAKTFKIDANLVKRFTKTFTVDSILKATQNKTFTIDALLRLITTKSFSIDAILRLVSNKTFTIDALLKQINFKAFTINAILTSGSITKTKTFLIDAILLTPSPEKGIRGRVRTRIPTVLAPFLEIPTKTPFSQSYPLFLEIEEEFSIKKQIELNIIAALLLENKVEFDEYYYKKFLTLNPFSTQAQLTLSIQSEFSIENKVILEIEEKFKAIHALVIEIIDKPNITTQILEERDIYDLPEPPKLITLGSAASQLFFEQETQQVIYRLEDNHEVEDECDFYSDEVYDIDDPDKPDLPIHPNCKCYWELVDTGEDLGQSLATLGAAEDEGPGRWITTDEGVRVFIKEGETLEQAFIRRSKKTPERKTIVNLPLQKYKKPTERHEAIANKIQKKYPNMDKEFLKEQAVKADNLRVEHEKVMTNLHGELGNQFKDADVTGRVKDTDNMVEKLGRKPDVYQDVSQLQDVSGVRVVSAKGNDDVKSIVSEIKTTHTVISEENYIDQPKAGYRSYHLGVEDKKTGLISEVQVRTQNQDHWATFAHDKVYKLSGEDRLKFAQNKEVINSYMNGMSEHYFKLDSGITNSVKPPCPPSIASTIGCM